MELQSVLDELKYNKRIFPRKALVKVIHNRDLFTPSLLEIIENSSQNIDSLLEDKKYFAHIFAMYLLAQFKEKKAYKLLIDFFSIPGDVTLKVTKDVVTEDLGRIFASVYDGDISLLKTLIEQENANEYVRAAAIEALLVLVANEEKTRQEIMDYFKELFNGKLSREFSHVWNALVARSIALQPEEVYEDIKKAYDDELVETFFVSFSEAEDALKTDKEQAIKVLMADIRYSLIDDTISEMGSWASFK